MKKILFGAIVLFIIQLSTYAGAGFIMDNAIGPMLPKQTTQNNNDEIDNYIRNIQRRIRMFWKIESPKKHNPEVIVQIKLSKDGELISNEIYKSSGDKKTDYAAIESIDLGTPYQKLPDEYNKDSLIIRFTFNDKELRAVITE